MIPWHPMSVELWLAVVILILFWHDLTAPAPEKPRMAVLAMIGLLPVFPLALAHPERSGAFFSGMYLLDPLARAAKIFFALTAILVLLMTREGLYKALHKDGNTSLGTVLKVVRALGLRFRAEAA